MSIDTYVYGGIYMCILDDIFSSIHHKWLCFTPFLNVLALMYYYVFHQEKTRILNFISFFIAALTISTILFWYSPVRNDIIHKIDKTVVHMVCFLVIGDVLFYKLFFQKWNRLVWFLYGIFLTLSGYFLYLSNHYSSLEWLSREHVFYHFWFHLFAKSGIWFIFL